jgi:hypothetical protein
MRGVSMVRLLLIAAVVIAVSDAARAVEAQQPTQQSGYPVPPRSLGEAEEITLALTAAPDEIASRADVWVLRGTDFVRVRTGTNGCACMVGRDLHEGSRYPICFDQEGARTSLVREMKEASLRAKGSSEEDVKRRVAAAYASGELRLPSRPSLSYMMSPRQVLFSSPDASGVRVGAWSPHLMLLLPGVAPDQLGLASASAVDIIQIHDEGNGRSELIVKVPVWSDGKPVARPGPPPS